jgi:preprotein translocase subunit SecY
MQKRQTALPRPIRAVVDSLRIPDLRNKILFTLGIILIFRFLAHIPIPEADADNLANLFERNELYGMLDLFSGGMLRNFSIAALGIYPYITASIVMQLLVPVIPALQALSREGEAGRRKINRYTHFLTLPMAALAAWGQIAIMQSFDPPVLWGLDTLSTVTIIITLTAGTMFLVWLGERITERGIGNGISILIFIGIVATYPAIIGESKLSFGDDPGGVGGFFIITLITVLGIVLLTEATRRIPVQYSRSMVRGGRVYRQGGSTSIPLRLNSAGMIPLIFAMSVILLPVTIANFIGGGFSETVSDWLGIHTWLYWILFFLLVVAFTFFYTAITFEQMNLPETLQKQGGFIPGIRPGKGTSEYLNRTINRITWGGALFLAVISIMPFIGYKITGVMILTSSAGLLIVVGVALDTMKQLESQLLMHRYEGFIK